MDITKQVIIVKIQIFEDDCGWKELFNKMMQKLHKETGCGVNVYILNQEFEDRTELIIRDIAKRKLLKNPSNGR